MYLRTMLLQLNLSSTYARQENTEQVTTFSKQNFDPEERVSERIESPLTNILERCQHFNSGCP